MANKFRVQDGITYPDGTTQSTAYEWVNPPVSSTGAIGDKEGMVAYDANYHYYCTADFGGVQYTVVHGISSSADGVNNGYLVYDNYQLPQVGWRVYYNGQTATIDQVNNSNPGYYIVFVSSILEIPGNATFAWGPAPVDNIWVRVAWTGTSW